MTVAQDPTDPVVEAPHEILGVPATERDPVRIVEAAEIRLAALARGGEAQVRSTLQGLIRQARDRMLRDLCGD